MGLLDSWKWRRYERRLERWQADVAAMEGLIAGLNSFRDIWDESDSSEFIADEGEEVLMVVRTTPLIESRKGPTRYSGQSSGVSVRVSKRVTVRQGRHSGSASAGAEVPTSIDIGTLVITDKRGVFVGPNRTREFHWKKLVSVRLEPMLDGVAIYMPVTNRERTSGIWIDSFPKAREIEQRIQYGVALSTGREQDFLKSLDEELAALVAQEPQKPAIAPSVASAETGSRSLGTPAATLSTKTKLQMAFVAMIIGLFVVIEQCSAEDHPYEFQHLTTTTSEPSERPLRAPGCRDADCNGGSCEYDPDSPHASDGLSGSCQWGYVWLP